MSFLSEYFDVVEGLGETPVCCPFDHETNGLVYKESHPSASVNTIKNVFHCMRCSRGYGESQFIQEILGCSYLDAKRIQRCFETREDILEWEGTTKLSEESKQKALNLGISETVLHELKIRTPIGARDTLAFPAFMYGHLIDIRTYDPGQQPKVRSRANCPSGIIIPYDTWIETPLNKATLVCAGEKDMAIAKTHGFNAITITGGEGALPKAPKLFANRHVVIAYDNDGAGLAGAKKLALQLLQYTPHIKVLTNFHEVCKEKGEDITDFFTKYNKTREDLVEYMKATPFFVPDPEDLKSHYPIVDLLTASKPELLNKMLQSNIQVVAVSEASFATPAVIIAEKYKMSGDKDILPVGAFREWELSEDNAEDILHLIDNNFKEDAINKNIRNLLKVPQVERCMKIKTVTKRTVHKIYVTDLFETTDTHAQPMEYTAYSIGCKLESGKKYLVTYKLAPHPYKGQQLTMVITDAVEANDSVTNFVLNDEVKANLKVIQDLPGTVPERIELLTEKVKGLLGYNGNNTLIQAIDFAYHTALQFNFGSFHNVRGYLDTIVVGESRVGKSSTADALRNVYGLGVFTSLAGNSATIPGLVGGSNKTAGGYQTRAGIIPQNHKGLIIFEEFGKSNANVIKELTDIRSSNEVRITRVSGTIALPAIVRMIALTNVKNTNGMIKPIASYPNGISILTELVETAEDIARYDLIVILADRGSNQIDPYWRPQDPLPTPILQTRVRWIWSRKTDQINIAEEVGRYILDQANDLNRQYECHIKLFGTEAWKKISRLAIAIAGYLVSTDESYTQIIVTKEHVDYAVDYFKRIYDNSTFKLKEYVEHEKRYSTVNEECIANLQDIYNKHPGLVLQLEQCSTASKNMLAAATGLSNDDLNKALKVLTKGLFIRFQNYDIVPTERFRLSLSQINKGTHVNGVGES